MESYKYEDATENDVMTLSGYIFYYSLKLKARLESSSYYSEKMFLKSNFINEYLNPVIKYLEESKVPVKRPYHRYKSALQKVLLNLFAIDDYFDASEFDSKSDYISASSEAVNKFNQNKDILYCALHKKDYDFEFESYIDTPDENILSDLLYYLCTIVMYTHAEMKFKNVATTLSAELMRAGVHTEEPDTDVDSDPFLTLCLIDSISGPLNAYFCYEYRNSKSFKENAHYKAKLKRKAQETIKDLLHRLATDEYDK